jgi:hypothetical protein
MRAFIAKVNISTASADTEYRAVFTTLYLTFFELPSIRQLHGAGLQFGDALLRLLERLYQREGFILSQHYRVKASDLIFDGNQRQFGDISHAASSHS